MRCNAIDNVNTNKVHVTERISTTTDKRENAILYCAIVPRGGGGILISARHMEFTIDNCSLLIDYSIPAPVRPVLPLLPTSRFLATLSG